MLKLLFATLLAAAVAPAQVLDATHVGAPVELSGDWRFHTGDNPEWAKPDLDDSGWRLVSSAKAWDKQGLQNVTGYFWYRAKIKLPPNHGALSLLRSDIGPSEIYVDGKKLDGLGRFPPNPEVITDSARASPLAAKGSEISIALRYWLPPVFRGLVGTMADDLMIGTRKDIERQRHLVIYSHLARRIPNIFSELVQAAVMAGLLILFFLQRERTEYLFLAAALLAWVIGGINQDLRALTPSPMVLSEELGGAMGSLGAMAMLEFVFRFIREKMPKWLRAYQFALPLVLIGVVGFWRGWFSQAATNVVIGLYLIPFWFLTPGVVIWRFFRGNKEAGLLALPLLLLMLNEMLGLFGWILFDLHLRSSSAPFLSDWQVGLVAINSDVLFNFIFLLSVAALILYRFQKTRLDQVRAQAELEAARSMQEVMVPQSIDAAGFRIETAYLPAAEVGGDFFQLFPDEDGSLLVVIGDVSGKGLKAAMLVSMIVGLLRRTVDHTRQPGIILNDLNRMLIGHTEDKFATCCCALIFPDGQMLAANAGHLSPYCDGQEIELPGGVPLGISPDAGYQQMSVSLPPGKRIVFLSDGVVEARDKNGQIYGFERTRSISIRTVNEIAQTAQQFGQEDDITVLGIVAFA